MKKKEKKIISKNLIIKRAILISTAVAATAFLTLFGVYLGKSIASKKSRQSGRDFNDLNSYYSGSQVEISDADIDDDSSLISITSASAAPTTDYSSKTITISTPEEIYLFSTLCNTYTSTFMTYKYKLMCNLDCSSLSSDFIPVGWAGTGFSGTFDGQGYEITNLKMITINSSNYETYSAMTYYAMFSIITSTGVVKNFGLVDPQIVLTYVISNLADNGVANVVGDNKGTVEKVFVRQLSTTLLDECGITAAGGYSVAGICVKNEKTLKECYIATNSIYNYTAEVNEFADVVLTNTGTVTDCAFYNTSILNSASSYTEGTAGYTFAYVDDLGADTKISSDMYYGDWMKTSDELFTKFQGITGWYTPSTYGYLGSHIPMDTPVSRGITASDIVSDARGNVTSAKVTVTDVRDFIYMYELMNNDAFMASNAITYEITNDINLSNIPLSCYTYSHGIGATITGAELTSNTVELADNSQSGYPTIFNADITASSRKVTTSGLDCYGMFPYLTGTISNLNIVPQAINLDSITATSNATAVGAVAGYCEKGTISNVSVYVTITDTTSASVKEYYVGGITGVLGGEGSVTGSTSAGTINLKALSSFTDTTGYMSGIAVGGAVGYIENSMGSVTTCLNAADITFAGGSTSVTYAVGGLIGAGYTKEAEQLENDGSVTISASPSYKYMYVSGIIGRLMGVSEQIDFFENQGTITVNGSASGTKLYVSGILNADIQTSATASNAIKASSLTDKSGNTVFYASGMTNRANVVISTSGLGTNLEYTSGINVVSSNGFDSTMSSVFNLDNSNLISNNTSTTGELSRVTKSLGIQTISLNNAYRYAPVVNVIGGSESNIVTLKTVYNLRNYQYTTSAAITSDITITGVVLGEYVNCEDVRNEGNMDIDLTYQIGTSSVSNNLKFLGVMEEISTVCTADTIYNSGDVDINYTANIYGTIYASGIAYANRNGYSSVAKFNPSDSVNYDSKATGSLNQVINNGAVTVTNSNYTSVTYTLGTYWDVAASGITFNTYSSSYSGNTVVGNIYASGVINVNESVITNTFNLGNVSAYNYSISTSADTIYEINSAGLSNLNIGQYSYIENSANNGDIIAVNLSSATMTTGSDTTRSGNTTTNEVFTKTVYLADVNSSGISGRNDETESSDISSNGNSKQVIAFTINYGSVIAYNMSDNINAATDTLTSKASGIIGSGLSNVINVLNYGNIYGNEIIAGIFGAVDLTTYESEISSSNVNIANTIDYGNVYYLAKGYTASTSATDYKYMKYSDFIGLNQDSTAVSSFAMKSVSRGNAYNYATASSISFLSFAGAIYGLINYNNSSSAANINIRYLLNFYDGMPLAGTQLNVPSVTADVSTIYSSYSTKSTVNAIARDSYLGTYVNYSPLSKEDYSDLFMKTYGDAVTTTTLNVNGLFSDNFMFKKIINGKVMDGVNTYYNTSSNPTDKFLTDYFQFVSYSYVNEFLMNKIGWKSIAYADAATQFATTLNGMYTFLAKYSTVQQSDYEDDVEDALETSTWSQYASQEILTGLLEELIDENSVSQTTAIIDYLFSDACSNSVVINSAFRANIVQYIFTNYPDVLANADIINFQDYYSAALAEVLCTTDDNDVKAYIEDVLDDYISDLDGTTKEELLLAYIDYLETNGDDFFDDTTEMSKYQLLLNMFDTIDTSDALWSTLYGLFSTEEKNTIDTYVSSIAEYGGYNALSNAEKIALFQDIISQNSESTIATFLDTTSSSNSSQTIADEIGLFSALSDKGYDKTSFTGIQSDIASTSTSNTSDTVIDERVALWNQIKDTTTFQNYFTSIYSSSAKAYLATESNNTYQTTTNPVISSDYYTTSNNVIVGYNTDIAPERIGTDQDQLFIYTQTITPSTYFLGPYTNESFGDISSYISTQKSTSKMSAPSSTSVLVNTNMATKASSKQYASLLIYSDDSVASLVSKHTGTTGAYNSYEVYYNEVGRKQFTDKNAIQSGDASGTVLGINDATFTYNNKTYSLNRASITYNGSSSFKITPYGMSEVTISGNFYINGTSYSRTNGYNYIWNNYTIPMYTTTTTTGWHKTGYSGLYMVKDDWTSGSTNYYCLVWDGNSKYSEIIATRYIDYSATQILALDGYLTSYSDGTTKDSTERDIINQIFNTYLLTSTNRTKFVQIMKKALLESLEKTASNTDNINFMDQWMSSNINTETKVNGGRPLVYLACDLDSDSTTVSGYLSNKNPLTGRKAKIINAAAGNKDVFCKLISLLFDEELSEEAAGTWTPTGGAGFGGSISVSDLYSRIAYISGSGNTSWASSVTSSTTSSYPNSYYMMPLMVTDTISQSNYTTLGGGTTATYNTWDGSNKLTNASSTNYGYTTANIAYSSYENVSGNNIGYYTGASATITGETPETMFTVSGDLTGSSGHYTDFKVYQSTASEGAGISEYTGMDSDMKDSIKNMLNADSGLVYTVQLKGQISTNNQVATNKITVAGNTYDSSISFLPNSSLWFVPQQSGMVKIVVATKSDGTGNGFSLYQITRQTLTGTAADSSNPFHAPVDGATEITAVYQDASGNYYYNPSDTTDLTLVYASSWTKKLTAYSMFYFEIPVVANQEYALGSFSGSGPYLMYLDLGQNGTTDYTTEKNYYVQHRISSLTDYDDYLNNLIIYAIPLEGKDDDDNYTVIRGFVHPTEYDEDEVYYSSTGSGTTASPYVYTKVTSGITSSNYTSYYVIGNTAYTIEDFQDKLFTTEFIKKVIAASNSATLSLIKSLTIAEELNDIVYEMAVLNSKLFDSVLEYENVGSATGTDADAFRMMLTAGYLATDYYSIYNSSKTNSSVNVSQTKLYQKLSNLATTYQYINSDGSIDNDKFDALCTYIGYPKSNMAFGIYALAANTGIKNGAFIPDNIELSDMDISGDTEYNEDRTIKSTISYNLLATDSFGTSIIALTKASNTSWRDNTGTSTSSSYDTSVTTSVNYAFRVEMKQLKLAISTTLFELDLEYSDDYALIALETEINEEEGVITYYVPSSFMTTLAGKSAIEITNINYADTATFTTNNSNTSTINVSESGTVTNGYTVENALTVTAEDTTVYKSYSIKFVPITISYSIDSVTPTTLDYTGGKVTISLSTTSDGLPAGFDFSPFLSIVNGTNSYKSTDSDAKWSLDTDTKKNGIIVKTGTGDSATYTATLVINIDASLPGGSEVLTFDVFGTQRTTTITKTKATDAYITAFEFEGTDLTTGGKYASTESTIKFGRAYDYTELTDYTSSDFYLSKFEISDNATVSVTAAYAAIKVNGVDTGRIAYTVTYVVTPEDGSAASTYTHTLTESDYFSNGTAYANLYKEGTAVGDSALYTETFTDGTVDVDGADGSLNYTSGDVNFAAVAFNRGVEPEYRIKYVLNNFYTLGSDVTYAATAATKANGASVTVTYAGLTVTVSDNQEPGTYKFEYTYTNTGTWATEDYTRSYTFPALYIVKLYSTDSLLNRVTFLDQSIVIGNTATVMKTNTSESTSILVANGSGSTVDGHEALYSTLFGASSRDIDIRGKSISYNNGSSGTDISDYYLIGTVSDSDLSYYAPTFGIEDHAQIYQYTTQSKLTGYGEGQTVPDAEILTDHDDIFLYVPYTKNDAITVFLVKLDEDGYWSDVYTTDYDGADSSKLVYTYTNDKTTYEMTSTPSYAAFNGYELSSSCGKVKDNNSLYMDYVGNPLDNHFWYVSYLVFSEAYLHGDTSDGNVRYYHISIIDATNTVYFEVQLYAPADFSEESLYLTISENVYNDTTKTATRQVSGYMQQKSIDTSGTDVDGMMLYTLKYNLQVLPKGYFYFYVDLPNGYVATASTDMANQIDTKTAPGKNETGSFLPFTSIITKTIYLTIVVTEGTSSSAAAWAVNTSDLYTRQCTYK